MKRRQYGVNQIKKQNLQRYLTKEIDKFVEKNFTNLEDKERKNYKSMLEERFAKQKRSGISNLRRWDKDLYQTKSGTFYRRALGASKIRETWGNYAKKGLYTKEYALGIESVVNKYSDFYYTEEGNESIHKYNEARHKVGRKGIKEARENLLNKYYGQKKIKDAQEEQDLFEMAFEALSRG